MYRFGGPWARRLLARANFTRGQVSTPSHGGEHFWQTAGAGALVTRGAAAERQVAGAGAAVAIRGRCDEGEAFAEAVVERNSAPPVALRDVLVTLQSS